MSNYYVTSSRVINVVFYIYRYIRVWRVSAEWLFSLQLRHSRQSYRYFERLSHCYLVAF